MINPRLRRMGWLICLVLVLVLILGGLKPGINAYKQAIGVRGLLQAGASLSSDDIINPFVCLRAAGNSALAKKALLNINDQYLRGVGLCLAGEREAGLAALKEAGGQSNAEVQNAASLSATNPQAAPDTLAAGLNKADLIRVLQQQISHSSLDPFPALRQLAQIANNQPKTWTLWLQGCSRLEAAKQWQAALDWLKEGLAIAPATVQGSLNLHAGRIIQTQIDPRDDKAALAFYNQALENGGWISPSDEVNAHIYRGEVYRSLKDEYGPKSALEEFNTALKLQPDSYWALIEIGVINLNDYKAADQAEVYFRQALAVDGHSPYAYLYLGDVFRARGDKLTAADWYHQALEHQPNLQPALDGLKALEGK